MASLPFHILLECAKAIERRQLDLADSLLAEIQSLAPKEESIWTRKVVQYCAEALVRRAYGIRPPFPLPSLPFIYEPGLFATITSKHAITDALNSGNKRLHIIDFSIVFGFLQWNYLIEDLKEQYGGLQSVLITSITPKLSKHSDYLRQNWEWTRQFGGTNLELRQLIFKLPDDIVNCISKLRRKSKDEMVVVSWNYILHKLLEQDGAIERVLSKVKDLEADIMVVVEQEANINSPDLLERLEQSFQFYSPIFESLEKTSGTVVLWDMYFRRQIGNVVACEGVDRVERIESFAHWQNRLSQAGFCPVPQQVDKLKIDFPFYLNEHGIEEKEGHILLCWHGFPVAASSVWKFTDPPQCGEQSISILSFLFSCYTNYPSINLLCIFTLGCWKNMLTGLYTMQDTVDDSERMTSSSESEDDEENDSLVCMMADRNLWSTQGSSMNRIAASAKLFDILEYMCDLHRLPLAVTWISYGQDGNTNSKGKRILCMDHSACYVKDWSMEKFLFIFAQHRLGEGKGIAGKALQSNIHIQHDISVLDPADCPYADYQSRWGIRTYHAAFAVRLTSTHSCKDYYVLEFVLPISMEETSERELLINKVLRTLQRKCLKMWEVSVREVNEASGSEVRLDDERMPNISLEENGYMTANPTSNQAEETREPLEQDVQEQYAIPAPALNGENASPSVDGGLQSTSKRRKISTVWDRFVKHRGENGEVWATCKYCKKKYRAESKRGTSNLHKHLKNCSPSRQDEAEQQILVETGELSTSVIQGNFVIDQERSRLDIATMMIKHGYPLTMVQLYSKDVVEADVLAICRTEKEKLIKFFDKLSCLLSLTLELWSSTDKMMTYCCFTVHFIDDGWQLKKKILAFRNLRYNYDMGTVHEVFKSVLAEWSINKNVRFIFLDITPPKDHMIGELRSKVSDQAPPIHEHLFCVPSYAHILSLLAQDGFSEIRSVLYKIRECIEYVRGSSLRRQRFQEAINNRSLQSREMPTLDVPARWDTTFLMLESSLEFITAFNHLEQLDDDFKVNPSAEEWNKATAVFECLKEFYKSTCNFPTSRDDYFLSVRDVYKNLHGWKQSDYVYVGAMANRMKGKFDEYWGEASLALGMSAVLDPSFKLDIIEYGYRQIYGSDADLHLSRFRYDLTCAYHKYAEDISNQGPSSSAMADVSCCTSSYISFKEWRKGKYERNRVHSQWNELDQYLQLPPENLDKDGNVLAWWRDNAQNFPILGKMARDFLSIPVSAVISKSSEVMKMASVHDGVRPEMAEALICGKDWLDSPNCK
ncbi:hypothetical protein POTOM_052337 [Populus tomentosa]|uniref:BED-type domain-containing protein n=1 Tax=Populus tomentosa TaxID=118781 RepID=A0A8X7Y3D4_POPTO|nr:hypothetical protein POTOM_052337 [Populus tomentosa]